MNIWVHSADSGAEWTRGLIERIEGGAYTFAGEGEPFVGVLADGQENPYATKRTRDGVAAGAAARAETAPPGGAVDRTARRWRWPGGRRALARGRGRARQWWKAVATASGRSNGPDWLPQFGQQLPSRSSRNRSARSSGEAVAAHHPQHGQILAVRREGVGGHQPAALAQPPGDVEDVVGGHIRSAVVKAKTGNSSPWVSSRKSPSRADPLGERAATSRVACCTARKPSRPSRRKV